MPKNVNPNPFKTVAVVLFTFVALFASNIAWGQTLSIVVPSMQPNGTIVPVVVSCPHYPTSRDPWNGVYTTNVNPATGQKERLENLATSGLNFPVSGVSAADVDRFFDTAYLSAGYTRDSGSGASMSSNCHGFSTGKHVWLQAFSSIQRQVDYTARTQAKFLADVEGLNPGQSLFADNIVLAGGSGGHSVRVNAVGRKLLAGELEYQVLGTIEKYNASGLYKKEITLPPYAGTDTPIFSVVTGLSGGAQLDISPVFTFYKAK